MECLKTPRRKVEADHTGLARQAAPVHHILSCFTTLLTSSTLPCRCSTVARAGCFRNVITRSYSGRIEEKVSSGVKRGPAALASDLRSTNKLLKVQPARG